MPTAELDISNEIAALFSALGLPNISLRDSFTVECRNGFIMAEVIASDGVRHLSTKRINDQTNTLDDFDPDKLLLQSKRTWIYYLTDHGWKIADIVRVLNIPYGVVNYTLNLRIDK